MTDNERAALIGNAVQEHKALKQTLACLAVKADQMQQAVTDGLRLIAGETTGHIKDGQMTVATKPHSMQVKGCDWPTVEAIGELASEREAAEKRLTEVAAQLRNMGMGDYVR